MCDSQRIRIWQDQWIPKELPDSSTSEDKILEVTLAIYKLIDYSSGWWNVPLLNEIFSSTEAKQILSLCVSVLNRLDYQVWNYTSSGHFSVRSAYHHQQHLNSLSSGESFFAATNRFIWNIIWHIIWHLSIPTVVKIFL